MALGGRATVRYRAPRWWGDDGAARTVEASLQCVEHVPPQQWTVAVDQSCRTRVVAVRPWFEAEIDLVVPLGALTSAEFAGHRVDWVVQVRDSAAPGAASFDVPVRVAPVVAPGVLQGDDLT